MLHTKLLSASELSTELGDKIKRARQMKCMPQSELAVRAGISRKTLIALEVHGQSSLLTFIRVLTILGQLDNFQSLLTFKPSNIVELEQQALRDTTPQRIRKKYNQPMQLSKN